MTTKFESYQDYVGHMSNFSNYVPHPRRPLPLSLKGTVKRYAILEKLKTEKIITFTSQLRIPGGNEGDCFGFYFSS